MDVVLDGLSGKQSLRQGSLGEGFLGKSSQEEGNEGSRLGQITQGWGLSRRQLQPHPTGSSVSCALQAGSLTI